MAIIESSNTSQTSILNPPHTLYPHGIKFDNVNDRFDGPEDVHSRVLEHPLSIVFNTSHECNLHCPYCFRRGSGLPPQSHNEIMSDLKKLPVGKPMRNVLSGGEPFWREDIYDIINFCSEQPWNMVIVTNGTYQIDFNKIPQNFLFEFSLDAPNAEIYKLTRGGTLKNYAMLVSNIHEAVLRGYKVRPCYLMSRVNTTPAILEEIMDFSASLGVKEVRLQRFKPWGAGKHLSKMYEFKQDEYQNICSQAVSYAENVGLKVRVPQNNRFLALGSVFVLPNGDVTIQEHDGAEQSVLGNLHNQTLEDIWLPHQEKFSKMHLEWLIRPQRII